MTMSLPLGRRRLSTNCKVGWIVIVAAVERIAVVDRRAVACGCGSRAANLLFPWKTILAVGFADALLELSFSSLVLRFFPAISTAWCNIDSRSLLDGFDGNLEKEWRVSMVPSKDTTRDTVVVTRNVVTQIRPVLETYLSVCISQSTVWSMRNKTRRSLSCKIGVWRSLKCFWGPARMFVQRVVFRAKVEYL